MTQGITLRDFVRLAWCAEGRADAPAVLLLNALATERGMWDTQAMSLRARHRVLRFGWRGHGVSGDTETGHDFEGAAEDAVAVLADAGISRVHLVGLSMGGVVAMQLALRRPGLVASLVLCATQAAVDDAFRQSCDTRVAAVLAGGMEPLVEPTLARCFAPGFDGPPRAAIGAMFRRTRPAAYAGYTAALRQHAMLDAITAIRAPTLVVAGGLDATTPVASLARIAAAIPAARLHVMSGSAHFPNLDAPAAFDTELLAFLA